MAYIHKYINYIGMYVIENNVCVCISITITNKFKKYIKIKYIKKKRKQK